MHTLLAIAVFTDNRELFDNAVYHYLHANANGSLIKYIYLPASARRPVGSGTCPNGTL